MESTQCPVCNKTLDGSVNEVTQHVNMCIDDNESTNYIRKLVGYGGWAFPALQPAPIEAGPRNCPICGRVKGGNPTHIKKCGKEHNVDTKKLISLYKVDSKRPKPNSDQSGEPSKAADKLQINRRKRNAPGPPAGNAFIVPSSSGVGMRLSKAPPLHHTELTRLTKEEKEARIKERREHILATNIIADNCIFSQPFPIPKSWKLSSLGGEGAKYVVNGFEKFCRQTSPVRESETFETELAPPNDEFEQDDFYVSVNDQLEAGPSWKSPLKPSCSSPTPSSISTSERSEAEMGPDFLALHTVS